MGARPALVNPVPSLLDRLLGRIARTPLGLVHDWLAAGPLGVYIWRSRRIPSWTRGRDALELARTSFGLDGDPVVVEIGSFVGASAVLLAGARKLRGSGVVHCIDPFDASGDEFSAPFYRSAAARLPRGLRAEFDDNIRRAGVGDWVRVHCARSVDVAAGWSQPVDLLFIDGDQTHAAVVDEYRSWEPHLKIGGIVAVHNTIGDPRPPDGHRRLMQDTIRPPRYRVVARRDCVTFARKLADA